MSAPSGDFAATPGEGTPAGGATLSPWPPVVFALLGILGAAWFIEQTGPEADWRPLALSLAVLLPVGLLPGWRRRVDGVGVALALFAIAITSSVAASLPLFPSPTTQGDSPYLGPLYGMAGVAIGLWFLLNPLRLAAGERVVLALALFAAGNGKLWTRSNADFFPYVIALTGVGVWAVGPWRSQRPSAGEEEASRAERWCWPLGALFVAWTLAAACLGDYPGRADELAGRVVAGLLTGWWTAKALDRRGVERLLVLLGLVGFVGLAWIPILWDSAEFLPWTRLFKSRLRLFGLHPNLTGTFLAVHLVFAVAMAVRRRGWLRILLGLSALSAASALVLTRSRSAWLATLAGLVLVVLVRRTTRKLWVCAASVAALGVLSFFLITPLREAAVDVDRSQHSIGQRLYIWDAAAALTLQNPILGVGPSNYFAHSRTFESPSFFDNTDKSLHTHNLLLSVSEGTGLVGLALFLLLGASLLGMSLRAASRGSERASGVAIFAGAATLFSANLFDLGLSQVTFVPTLMWILLGAACVLTRKELPVPQGESTEAGARPGAGRPPAWAAGAAWVGVLLFAVRPFVAERFVAQGDWHKVVGRSHEALEAWRRAGFLMPLDIAPPMRRARLLRDMGSEEEAARAFEAGIARSPMQHLFRYDYGRLLMDLGRYEEAAEQLSTALATEPHGPEEGLARKLYGETLARIGRVEEARAEFARVVEVSDRMLDSYKKDGWKLEAKGGETLDLIAILRERGAAAVASAGENLLWQNRRLGDNIGRNFIKVDLVAEGLAMIEAIQQSSGQEDASLKMLALDMRARLDPDQSGEVLDADTGARARWIPGVAPDMAKEGRSEEALALIAQGMAGNFDLFADVLAYQYTYEELFEVAEITGDVGRGWRGLEGALHFTKDVKRRMKYPVRMAQIALGEGEAELALAAVRIGIEHSSSLSDPLEREQHLVELARVALEAETQGAARLRLERIEASTRVRPRGPGWMVFRVWLRLHLGRIEEAQELLAELRRAHPDEGPSLDGRMVPRRNRPVRR